MHRRRTDRSKGAGGNRFPPPRLPSCACPEPRGCPRARARVPNSSARHRMLLKRGGSRHSVHCPETLDGPMRFLDDIAVKPSRTRPCIDASGRAEAHLDCSGLAARWRAVECGVRNTRYNIKFARPYAIPRCFRLSFLCATPCPSLS
eukprot:SAG11_NODE_615_length_8197_cov_4.551426_11_plen_147_part_00